MASSRRLPLAYNVSTFGDVTRDYQSLSTWEAATDNNLVTATSGEVLDCYPDASSYDQTVNITGAVADANYFRVIRAASGQGHTGIPGTGFKLLYTGVQTPMINMGAENYVSLYDLEIEKNGNSGTGIFTLYGTTGTGGRIIGCIITSLNAGAGGATGVQFLNGSNNSMVNTLVYECKSDAVVHQIGATNQVYNCTLVDSGTGVDFNGGTLLLKNCVIQDNTADIQGSPTETTNVTSGVIFRDASNDNYLLASNDTGAVDQGTDLSSDINYAFTDDILFNEREIIWDVGFYDLAASGLLGKGLNRLGMKMTLK